MAKHQISTNEKENAILTLEKSAVELVIERPVKNSKEHLTLEAFKAWLRTKPGEHHLAQIATAATDEKGRILLYYKDEDIIKAVSKCRECRGRGYKSVSVKFKTLSNGAYERDKKGKAIEESRSALLCKCVTKANSPIKPDHLRTLSEIAYEREEAQKIKQAVAEGESTIKKKPAKAKPAVGDGSLPKATKRKKPGITE